jgi:hypothetical protein
MRQHFNSSHRLVLAKPGRPAKVCNIAAQDGRPVFREVYCQLLFVSGAQSFFFTVNVPDQVQELVKNRSRGHADVFRALINEQLTAGNHEQDARAQIYSSQVSKTEVSPSLEMTRWPHYFHGLSIAGVAPLSYAANPITKTVLVLLGESFDRLIEHAHQPICEDRISVFDQAQSNSFIAGRSGKHDRMFKVKLAKNTFRAYKSLWKRLLWFVYRTSQPTQSILLPHRLNNAQLSYPDQAIRLAEKLTSPQRLPGNDASPTEEEEGVEEVLRDLARTCLLLCIALLVHTLQRGHFESVVLSFLAVRDIDESSDGVFCDPLTYSPVLCKFIKMAQMFVVQRSVVAQKRVKLKTRLTYSTR